MFHGDWLVNAQHPPLVKQLMAVAQLVLGDTRVAARLPSAVAAWVTGLLLAVLVWRTGRPGRWSAAAGIGTALLWWTLPFDPARVATLEAVTCALVVAALLAWVLATTGRDPRWLLVGGAVAGLAGAAKLTGGLALVGLLPAALLLARDLGTRRVLPFALGSGVAAVVAWVFTFVPMEGDALAAMTTPVTFQLGHAEAGHDVLLAGTTYRYAPAWASGWLFVDALGPLAAGGLTLAALVGVLRHPRTTAPVAVTLVALVAALSSSPVQLSHYQFAWWPLFVALAGAGLAPRRTRRGPTRPLWQGAAATLAVLVALAPVARLSVDHVRDVAATRTSGLLLAPHLVDREIGRGAPLVIWADPWTTRTALPDQRLTTRMPRSLAPRALLVDRQWAGREGKELGLWLGCRPVPYAEHDLGEVIVYVREREPRAGEVAGPLCGPLLDAPADARPAPGDVP
ncbi:glycosyltransferase family 39 protein [Janibacter sp. CX7]|uniref:glycosyltransferase family 39 protein n=1 Tax=Janibacter sp. CX7 TaxID=2963431 RepID=UPI0020CD1649|nr:glycosyltransferase family 39 protein [Janibacter sp. CX7]UTT66487.1 glycosyltransferase family 39 protein [Janibacter sp. CX7]